MNIISIELMGLWTINVEIKGMNANYTHSDLKTAQIKAIGYLLNIMYEKLRCN